MSSEIIIYSEKSSYVPGEKINGEVKWSCKKAPEQIILSLEWRTTGRGTSDSETVYKEKIPCSGEEGQVNFSIKAPYNYPPSYRGRLISILWRIKATADISWARDPKTHLDVVISKSGEAYTPPVSD